MTDADKLRVSGSGERWRIDGGWPEADLQLCNDYLSYLADRRYSPASVRAYAFDLLHFARWLAGEDTGLDAVDTDALLRYLAACRAEHREGQHGNVISLASGRASGFAAGHHQPAAGGDLGPVQLPVDAGSGRAQPGAAGRGRAAHGPRGAGWAARSPGPAEAAVEAEGPRAPAAATGTGPGRDRRPAVQLPHRPGPGDRRADAAVRAALG